jgi:hypothetical protein
MAMYSATNTHLLSKKSINKTLEMEIRNEFTHFYQYTRKIHVQKDISLHIISIILHIYLLSIGFFIT